MSLHQEMESTHKDYFERFESLIPPQMVRGKSTRELIDMMQAALKAGKPIQLEPGEPAETDESLADLLPNRVDY